MQTSYKSVKHFIIGDASNTLTYMFHCINVFQYTCSLCAVGECVTYAMMLIHRFKVSLYILFHTCPLKLAYSICLIAQLDCSNLNQQHWCIMSLNIFINNPSQSKVILNLKKPYFDLICIYFSTKILRLL